MNQWYHSGVEGYCKAAAALMGRTDSAAWGSFGADLFGEQRFASPVTAASTWTLSRSGKGRASRPKLFETYWRAQPGADALASSALLLTGSELALAACTANMMDPTNGSPLFALYEESYRSFAANFHQFVMPAIRDGFQTERFHSADIERFLQRTDSLLGDLTPDTHSFQAFAQHLVCALIYGPGSSLALDTGIDQTRIGGTAIMEAPYPQEDDLTLRVTHVLSENYAYLGYSELFEAGSAVLFGRHARLQSYLDSMDVNLRRMLSDKTCIVFPVPRSHKRVSANHGALARTGDSWYYYDFSSNGTTVSCDGILSHIRNQATVVEPGTVLYLGASAKEAGSTALYEKSACVHIACHAQCSNMF